MTRFFPYQAFTALLGKRRHPELAQFHRIRETNKRSMLQISSKTCDISIVIRKPNTYHSSVIINIFAVHHQLVVKTDKFYGYPGGALSLCAAAQECALKLWRSSDPPDKDTKMSFVRRPWATCAAAHFQTIKKLLESKWHVIVEAAVSVVDSRNEEFDPTGENNSKLDDPDGVVISEDEAVTTD
ncbi:hypothetical protein BYT27DRAFT_7207122 [Phlegmacium glaucopus]|nr:hypothetical protein BYT27DRAFT_7207122 [Phlegmacium glaucopus]